MRGRRLDRVPAAATPLETPATNEGSRGNHWFPRAYFPPDQLETSGDGGRSGELRLGSAGETAGQALAVTTVVGGAAGGAAAAGCVATGDVVTVCGLGEDGWAAGEVLAAAGLVVWTGGAPPTTVVDPSGFGVVV